MRQLQLVFALTFVGSSLAVAGENGLPVAHTGGFDEPTCNACHRPQPLLEDGVASVEIDVGPYVPGETQPIRVFVDSPSGRRWGFQLTARLDSDTAQQAGCFAAIMTVNGVPAENPAVAVRDADGAFTECEEGVVQYVTHTTIGAEPTGNVGRKTFAFEWTPPAEDVGAVTFAAAGLAADGDDGTNSDLTATSTTQSLYAPTASPSIDEGGIGSAAAFREGATLVSRGEIISIYGGQLQIPGTAREVGEEDLDDQGRLPTELGRLSVIFTYQGVEYPARLFFVGENQVNAQAPDLPAGAEEATVEIVVNRDRGDSELRTEAQTVDIAPTTPALFTVNQQGTGEVAALRADSFEPIASADANIPNAVQAQPGIPVALFGTGFGPTTPPVPPGVRGDGEEFDEYPTVTIGGAPAEVTFAGAAPGFAGLTQLNVVTPNVGSGLQPVVVQLPDGTSTQANAMLAIGP